LNKFGYTIGEELQSGEDLRACMVAFQRHFRPSRCDGHWDAQCSDVLDNLLKKI
jgi:N-acetyl-anhydromuramyl-L-alanine amidase AmpD